MRNLIQITLILISLMICAPLSAQIGFGGTPPSWNQKPKNLKSDEELKSHIISNPFTIEQLIEDEEKSDNLPERVGINLSTSLSLAEDGEWEELSTGEKICRLKIESSGALAIALYYSQFKIPEGGELYIYNGERSHLLGAYTSKTNPEAATFASEFVAGDNLILEYVANGLSETPEIDIEKICYGYKNIKVSSSELTGCMVDVVCEEGDDWQNEKDGVVKMVTIIGNYSFLCSATLLNNTSEDFTPYIYSAFHCLEDDERVASAIDLKQSIFYFNYEATECGSDEVKETTTLIGCTFLEGKSLDSNEGLDQTLLLLNSDMPASLTPYFNGWDRGVKPPENGVSIHHPKGSVKKISTYITPAVSETWPSITTGNGVNAHWVVKFTRTANGFSATEGGSSGSPLFNQEKLVTGALTGGSSSCSNPSGSNYYAKFQRFWSYVSKYLDPINSGVDKLTGKRKGEVVQSPKALNAKFIENATKSQLSWLPLSEQPSNYIVYRNGVIVGRSLSNSFVDDNIYTGKHIYQVSGYYADTKTETPKSNQTILVKSPVVTPAIDTVVRISDKDVVLSWSLPQSEQTIFWGSGTPSVIALSTDAARPIYLGQMWNSSDLADVDGYVIKRVVTKCFDNINYTLYLRQGTNIYTQQLPITDIDKEVEITLDKEFVISNSASLYCSLRINSGEGNIILVDNGEMVRGKGNKASKDGYEWFDADTKGNVYIKAVISPPLTSSKGVEDVSRFGTIKPTSSLPVEFNLPKQYRLYRNGELLTTLSSLTSKYTDKNLLRGVSYEYRIEAEYNNGEICSSIPYDYYLRDKSFISKIEDVTVNGIKLDEEKGYRYNYSATCLNDYADVVVKAKENGRVIINGREGEKYSEDISPGGKYILPITIISESGESKAEYELNIYKLPDDILLKRWDDVLTIMNNPNNNGSLSFVEYNWYMNGEKLPDTEPYITLPSNIGSNDMFSVKVVTEEGIELKSCDINFEDIEGSILLYPTIVRRGEKINLSISYPQPCTVTATLSHLTGQVMPLSLSVGDNIINAPQVSGTYIINLVLSNGETRSLKFIVK